MFYIITDFVYMTNDNQQTKYYDLMMYYCFMNAFLEYLYIHQLYLTLEFLSFLYLCGFKWLAWFRGGYIPKQELLI